jgi:hypothetical protein
MLNDVVPDGSGAGGNKPQLGLGFSVGPDVVSDFAPAMVYPQSHAMMKPDAVEALPLKVQSKAFPLLMSLHTSVPDGPLTVNRATGAAGAVEFTVSVAVLVPLKFPVMTANVCVLTLLVFTVNVPLVDPDGMVMFAGTVAALELLESVTSAPPDSAGVLSVAVPCDGLPPDTVLGFNEIELRASAMKGPTWTVALAVVPPNEPVIGMFIEKGTTRVDAVNVALASPAGTVTLAGTVTGSAALSETTAPPAGAAPLSVAMPVIELPPITNVALSEIEARVTAGPGGVTVSIAV